MIRKANGEPRITLSWSQAVWSLATIATVVGCYVGVTGKLESLSIALADSRIRLERLETRMSLAEVEIDRLQRRGR